MPYSVQNVSAHSPVVSLFFQRILLLAVSYRHGLFFLANTQLRSSRTSRVQGFDFRPCLTRINWRPNKNYFRFVSLTLHIITRLLLFNRPCRTFDCVAVFDWFREKLLHKDMVSWSLSQKRSIILVLKILCGRNCINYP